MDIAFGIICLVAGLLVFAYVLRDLLEQKRRKLQPTITDKAELAMLDHIAKNEVDWPPEYDLLALYNHHISKGFVPSTLLARTMCVIQSHFDNVYLPSQGIHMPSRRRHL